MKPIIPLLVAAGLAGLTGCGPVQNDEQRLLDELQQSQKQLEQSREETSAARARLAEIEAELEETQHRLQQLSNELARFKQEDNLAFAEARRLMEAGELMEALRAFQAFIQRFPTSPHVTNARSMLAPLERQVVQQSRTWTSVSGVTVEARYLADKNAEVGWENVPLLQADGREIKIPRHLLSPADQQWLDALPGYSRGRAARPRPAPPSPQGKAEPPDAGMRTWTLTDGRTFSARYVPERRVAGGTIIPLVLPDGRDQSLPIRSLSQADQDWLQQQHAPAASRSADTRADSRVTLKLSSFDNTWTKLTDCRLIPHDSNDGDSFHVMAKDGKRYIFRIYCADTPESDMYPLVEQRIREQEEYFGLGTRDVLRVGKDATAFTANALRRPFTVMTRFEDARGSSRQPRYYAFVITSDGADLSHLLVANGLARAYGMPVALNPSNNPNVFRSLDALQSTARSRRLGAWARTR